MLVIATDVYATREWCRHEVLAAKRRRVPMVVVNAIQQGEQRSFPYLGNVPTVRWPPEGARPFETALGLLLKEVLRHTWFLKQCEQLRKLYRVPEDMEVMAYPPELLTALDLRAGKSRHCRYLYPDPPLGTHETELLREFDPKLTLITPTMLPALWTSGCRRRR